MGWRRGEGDEWGRMERKSKSEMHTNRGESPSSQNLLTMLVAILVDIVGTAHSRRRRRTRVGVSPILRGIGTTAMVWWVVGLQGRYSNNITTGDATTHTHILCMHTHTQHTHTHTHTLHRHAHAASNTTFTCNLVWYLSAKAAYNKNVKITMVTWFVNNYRTWNNYAVHVNPFRQFAYLSKYSEHYLQIKNV